LRLLPEEDREDLDNVYRWLTLCYRDLGDLTQMNEVLSEGQQVFPDDPVLHQLANTPPLILTKKGEDRWNQAQERKAKAAAQSANDHGI
jgi:hypothetical protein